MYMYVCVHVSVTETILHQTVEGLGWEAILHMYCIHMYSSTIVNCEQRSSSWYNAEVEI